MILVDTSVWVDVLRDQTGRATTNRKTVRSPIDCCIAQIAIEHDVVLLHRDRDFEVIAAVSPLREQRLQWT